MRKDYTFDDVMEAAKSGFSAGFEAAKELLNHPISTATGDLTAGQERAGVNRAPSDSPVDWFGGTPFKTPDPEHKAQAGLQWGGMGQTAYPPNGERE